MKGLLSYTAHDFNHEVRPKVENTWEEVSSTAVSYLRSAVPCHHVKNIKQNRQLHTLVFNPRKIILVAQETDSEFWSLILEENVILPGGFCTLLSWDWLLCLKRDCGINKENVNSINRVSCTFFQFICKSKIFSNTKNFQKKRYLSVDIFSNVFWKQSIKLLYRKFTVHNASW